MTRFLTRLSLLFAALALSAPVRAQMVLASTTTFNDGFTDQAYGLARAANGDLFVTGSISTGPGSVAANLWVGRFNSSMVLQSSSALAGTGADYNVAYNAVVAPDGTVYAVGLTSRASYGFESWMGHYSSSLVLLSSAAFPAPSPFPLNLMRGLTFSPAGELFSSSNIGITTTTGRILIAKHNPTTLAMISSAVFTNGFANPETEAIVADSSGSLYVAGSVPPAPGTSNDLWVAKYTTSLVFVASTTKAGPGGNSDMSRSVLVHPNGSVYVTGIMNNSGATNDLWVGRYDSNLVLQSSISINGSANNKDEGNGLALGNGGNILVSGSITETGQSDNIFFGEYTAGLALVSSRTVTSPGSVADYSYSIVSDTMTAQAWTAGSYNGDVWLARYTISPASPSAPSGFAGVAASSTSIQWGWADNSTAETGVRVKLGGTNLSGDLAADTTSWLQTGLTANATSGTLLAQAFNAGGTSDSGSAQGYSLTDPPNSISATFFGSSVAFTWPVMTNPAGTRWAVDRGTDGINYAQLYFSSAAAAYTDNTGLALGTSYYYRIRSANGDTVYSAHANATAIVFTGGGAPSSPSGFAGTAQSTSSILWSWTDNSGTESGYRVMAGATNVSGDLAANTTIWLQTGLAVNTSSGSLFVQAFNSTGTTNSGSVTRWSLASVPTGLASSSVFQTSATLTWAGTGTTYDLERSTGAGFALLASTPVASVVNTGLSAASTYYYRVLARNGDGIATAYASSITVIMQPSVVASSPTAPSGFAGTALSTTSILWSWTDNSSNETGFRVMSGAASLSGNLAANATTWTQTGLAVNTSTGPLFVQAFNSTGTADSASVSRFTLASVPASLASSSVFQTSATVSWAGSATSFQLERSTGAGFAAVSTGAAAAYGDTGLSAASTYFYRVLAYNGDALATAYTATITVITAPTPLPNAPSGFVGVAQSTTSILWSWTDSASNETGYRVMSGAANLSGDLAADTSSWLQTGLAVNVSTGPLFVQGFNVAGTVNSGTASRATLSAVPTSLAGVGVYQTSVTVNWAAGGNPGGTLYELERSTGTGYGLLLSSTALTYFDGYLTPAATHYYRVRSRNIEAAASAYASSIAVVALPAPPIPGSAGTPVGTALGTSSVTWTWTLASGATNHFLFRASDNSYLGSSNAGPFVQTALSPNVPYGLRAAGVNVGGQGPLSPSATVYTLAAVPSAPVASTVSATALSLSWSLNGNPAGTTAEVLRSTNAVVYSTLAVTVGTTASDVDLLGCTTYYYKVRHANGDGLPTAYVSFQGVTANTTPLPPTAFTAASNSGGTIGLSWSPSVTEGITGYRLYWDAGTGTVSYGAALAGFGPSATSHTTAVLTSSAAYTFVLRAVHRCGVEETAGAFSTSGAAVAPPALRAAIKEPDSGKKIHGNRVTILGELIYGSPSDAQQVLFQYKLAASSAWLNVPAANVNHPNPDFSFPYFTHFNVNALAAGDYDLRAVAYNRAGVPDSAPPSVRVTVNASATGADIDENDDNGAIKKDQTVNNTVTSVIDTAGAGETAPSVRVSIPPGAVNAATATVSVTANPTITTAAPSGMALVGSAIKIDLSNGQSNLNGTAAITLTYPDTVRFPSLLNIYYLNEATGQWSRDFNSTVDTTSRTVSGNTPHFSTFALLLGSAFAANLDSVQVYPVPFKPNGQNADEGRPFSAGDPNSGIIFANLAMGSEIKIYTMTGRQVSSLENIPITGTIRWDARNQDGRDVASGAYFAVIKAAGQKTVVKKLVIIR